MKSKKNQFSVIEIILVFALLSFSLAYTYDLKNPIDQSYDFTIESFVDAIYFNETIRIPTIQEDLSSSSITQNWSEIEILFNTSFSSYSISVSNLSITKEIYTCTPNYNKYVTQRVISIQDNTNYDFRIVTFGVCY